jgi:hypothetical protein
MIRKKHVLGLDPMGGHRFSEKIMLKQQIYTDGPLIMKEPSMLYALLAYHTEKDVTSWSAEKDAAVMRDLQEVHQKLAGRFGPAARLGPTAKARTLRGPGAGHALDGPFAETKEQLLGLYVLDVASEDEALDTARQLRRANPSATYEIRPVMVYLPGTAIMPTKG